MRKPAAGGLPLNEAPRLPLAVEIAHRVKDMLHAEAAPVPAFGGLPLSGRKPKDALGADPKRADQEGLQAKQVYSFPSAPWPDWTSSLISLVIWCSAIFGSFSRNRAMSPNDANSTVSRSMS